MPQVMPLGADLLRWYDRHRRSMPWRARPGQIPDPYHVWLSEIMLQQTTVAAVGPYFRQFVARFPTIGDLAAATSDEVMRAWAGLGYYARARNLHECARQVAAAGRFPRDVAGLRALPGIGAYTAAAVASIAFGVPVVPVDGNVERVLSRLFAITTPLPKAKSEIAAVAGRFGADPDAAARPADFTQALFDLGAMVCTPRSPACAICPWQTQCLGLVRGRPDQLPVKPPRRERPVRYGAHFWLEDESGEVLLRRRPERGLLGGMLGLPGTDWRTHPWSIDEVATASPQAATWRFAGAATHGFTHFELKMDVFVARVERIVVDGIRCAAASLDGAGLPTAMRRCVAVVRSGHASSSAVKFVSA